MHFGGIVMLEFIGITLSFIYIFLIIALGGLVGKKDPEAGRKFIHILLSNWWFIAMIFFRSAMYASLVPLIFIAVNYLSYRFRIFSSMERAVGGVEGLGTVYYAISLFLLAAISFSQNLQHIGGLAILIMGYGDGLAALIGKRFPIIAYSVGGSRKSLGGSLTMFFASLAVAFLILFLTGSYSPAAILTLAIAATLLEALTPKGLDNLSVPLGVYTLYLIFFL